MPDEIIEACIEAAVQAPVGLAGENWRFLIVKDQTIRTEIANHYADIMQDLAHERGIEIKSTHKSLMRNLHDMPCLILIFAIGEPQQAIPAANCILWFNSTRCMVTYAVATGSRSWHHLDNLALS